MFSEGLPMAEVALSAPDAGREEVCDEAVAHGTSIAAAAAVRSVERICTNL
ncbi:MAG TPA: hypothetical protein VKV02_03635 [Acidobacteriaceae bacterium]|nr:hypothetical protein [Acidobacteriaceae bacterium]